MKFLLLLYLFIGNLRLIGSVSCGNEKLSEIVSAATTDSASIFVFGNEEYNIILTQNMSNSLNRLVDSQSFIIDLEDHLKKTLVNGFTEYLNSYLNIVLFCKKKCIQDIMKKASDIDEELYNGVFLRHFSTWLIISSEFPINSTIMFDNVALVKLAYQPGNQSIDDKIKHEVVLERLLTLVWNPEAREWLGVDLNQLCRSTVFPNIQKGLNGRHLKASALEWRPFTTRHIFNNKIYYEGASIDIFNLIAEKYNFSYEIIEPKQKNWGQAIGNITLEGIIGQINRAEADFCIVPYGVSSEREKFVDFTYPLLANEYGAIYRRREDESHDWLNLVTCFTWQVYLCGTAAWVLVLGFSYLSKKSTFIHEEDPDHLTPFDIGVNIPLRQDTGMVNGILSVSSRILIFFWSLFCFLVTTVYIGNLVAFATAGKGENPFNSLEDLAQQTTYAVGTISESYGEELLRISKDPTLQQIFEKVLDTKNRVDVNGNGDLDNLLQRVRGDKFVLISSGPLRDIIKSSTCDATEMKQRFFPFYSGFLFPPRSPLRELFERELINLKELGIIDNRIRKWAPKQKQCHENKEKPGFKLDDLKSIGVVCSALVLAAGLVLGVELFLANNLDCRK